MTGCRDRKRSAVRLFTFFVLFFAQQLFGEDLRVLNLIENRHESVHQRVSQAVVAVQCPDSRSDLKTPTVFYGTGVVISPDGLVLTSSTVVPSTSKTVQVFFTDGRVMDARVLAEDMGTESCVLKIVQPVNERHPLPFVELSDSSKAAVGELAYTAGNPFHTIRRDGQVAWSVGTVSGIYKINSADEQSHYHGQILETDAAVNPGSDGGPLFDSNGRVLGILSLCFCESRWLGTAIPVHLIKTGLREPLQNLALVDSHSASSSDNSQEASAARSVPDGLRVASRVASKAMVKLLVKRAQIHPVDHHYSLVRRLHQRPDAPASGVMIEPNGYILTSAFNIDGEDVAVDAQLADGRTFHAPILGRNLGLDVALLKIEPPAGEIFPAIELCADPDLRIGRFITILGASEDTGLPTHTSGIISALGRFDGSAVQTDALTNYGNSGGPAIDLNGRLIGIASQVRTQSDWSQQNSGVGFFAQSDKILACINDLKAGRDIKAPPRAFLGVSPTEGSEVRGVKLERIVEGSAAAAAELRSGDIIVAVDGMDTHSWPALVRALKAHKPGDTVEITYQRGSVTARAKTTLTGQRREQR